MAPPIPSRAVFEAARAARAEGVPLLEAYGFSLARTGAADGTHVRRENESRVLDLEPAEVVAFEIGLKPVLFLRGAAAAASAGRLGDAVVVRRDRDGSEEIFASRDPALARETAALQAEDPTRHVARLGALMGYPDCCVAAFAAQDDRRDDARNRYAVAARSPADRAWAWELSDVQTRLVPFFPCSYACETARAFARRVIDAIDVGRPGSASALAARLGRRFLYLDDGVAIAFEDGAASILGGPAVCDGLAPLAALLASGDDARLLPDALVVSRAGAETGRVERVAPHLGVILPFVDTAGAQPGDSDR